MEGDRIESVVTYDKLSEFKENENHFSTKFSVGNVPWRSCIKKLGNFLCLYIECTKKEELKSSWSCYARIKLCLLNINSNIVGVCRETTMEFHAGEMWGDPKFMLWKDVLDPGKGFIKNDSIKIEVHVSTNLNSLIKKELNGFSGLTKNWNNSYLNCLLQILFFTEPLRSAIFRIPVGSEACEVLELQRIFYELQSDTRPVEPTKLIEHFDEEMKHNLLTENTVEFIGQLLSKLDSKMKRTSLEGTIPRLFQGKKVSCIKCRNVNYCKSDVEIFYYIYLNSEKSKTIHEAFKRNITTKRALSGKNRCDAGEYGLQKADQSIEYQLFPPFLHIHLNRCYQRGGFRKKYHGYFEFSKNICLDEYLQKPDPKNPANYTLHAVVVHTGNHEGGHYSLYINLKERDTWCKFDDDIVSLCLEKNAIDANFGIQCDEPTVLETSSTTACMLVYVRDSELPSVSQMMKKSDIPSNLLNCLNGDLPITVNVVLEESFKDNEGYDLYDEQKIQYREFKMGKNATVEDLIQKISKDLKQPPKKMRLWPFNLRSNRTLRPSFLDLQNVSKKTLCDVIGKEKCYMNIFLELRPCDSTGLSDLHEFDKMRDVLLFFKMFDPKLKKIQYFGHSYMPYSSKVTELIQILNKKAGFPQETELLLYEEIGPNMVEKVKNHSEYLRKVLKEMVDGSIIVFEKKEFFELPTCVDYFKDLFYRIEVSFIDKDVPNDKGFKIKLSRDTNYDQLAWAVSKKIGANPHSLIFFYCQRDKDTPDIHIKNDYEGTLDDLLYFAKLENSNTLFYKNCKIHGQKPDQKKQFTCLYLSSKLNHEKEFSLYIKENGTVSDFLVSVKKYIEMTEGIEGKLRLLDINCYNMSMNPKDKIPENNKNVWRIEDNDDLEDELLICCIKFHGEIFSTFDTPFLVKIKQGEPFANVKERIRKKLSLSEKDWKKFKIAIVHMGEIHIVEYIVNFSDFILPQGQSGSLDYYISIVEDTNSEDGECNDEKIPTCASCVPAVQYGGMDPSKPDMLEFSRESNENHSLNIFSALESKVSFLQDNNFLLKREISILKKKLQENASLTYQNKLTPTIVESVSNMNYGKITPTKKRREIPRNYKL